MTQNPPLPFSTTEPNPVSCHKAHWWLVGAILLISLWLRLDFVNQVTFLPHSDMASFDQRALEILEHGRFAINGNETWLAASTYRPPLYPLFLAAVYKVFGHHYTIVYQIQAILGTLLLAGIYTLGRITLSRTAALLGLLLCALYSPFIGYCGILLSETLFMTLFFWGISGALAGLKTKHWGWIVTGSVLIGLSGLTRPLGLLVALFMLLGAWGLSKLAQIQGKASDWSGVSMKSVLCVIAIALLAVSPWTLRNYQVFHRFVLVDTATGINMYVGNNELARGSHSRGYEQLPAYQAAKASSKTIVELNQKLFDASFLWIITHPTRYAQLLGKRLEYYLLTENESYARKYNWKQIPFHDEKRNKLYRVTLQILASAALLWGCLRQKPGWILLGIGALSFFGSSALCLYITRYRHPAIPFVFLLASALMIELSLLCKSKQKSQLNA